MSQWILNPNPTPGRCVMFNAELDYGVEFKHGPCPPLELGMASRLVMCANLLAHVPAGILENMPGKRYLLTFDTIEEAEKLIQMFKDHEED